MPRASFTETPGARRCFTPLSPRAEPGSRLIPELFRTLSATPGPQLQVARAPPTGNQGSGSPPRALGTAQLMSNAPVLRVAGAEPPTPTRGPGERPDAQNPAPAWVLGPACRGGGARSPGRAAGKDLRAPRPPRCPQLHLPRQSPGPLAGGGRRGGRCSAPRASPSRGGTHLTNPQRPLPALRGARRAAQSAPRRSKRRRRTVCRRCSTPPRRMHCAGSRRGSGKLRLRCELSREPREARPRPAVGRRGQRQDRGGAGVGPEGPPRSRAPWRQARLFAGG